MVQILGPSDFQQDTAPSGAEVGIAALGAGLGAYGQIRRSRRIQAGEESALEEKQRAAMADEEIDRERLAIQYGELRMKQGQGRAQGMAMDVLADAMNEPDPVDDDVSLSPADRRRAESLRLREHHRNLVLRSKEAVVGMGEDAANAYRDDLFAQMGEAAKRMASSHEMAAIHDDVAQGAFATVNPATGMLEIGPESEQIADDLMALAQRDPDLALKERRALKDRLRVERPEARERFALGQVAEASHNERRAKGEAIHLEEQQLVDDLMSGQVSTKDYLARLPLARAGFEGVLRDLQRENSELVNAIKQIELQLKQQELAAAPAKRDQAARGAEERILSSQARRAAKAPKAGQEESPDYQVKVHQQALADLEKDASFVAMPEGGPKQALLAKRMIELDPRLGRAPAGGATPSAAAPATPATPPNRDLVPPEVREKQKATLDSVVQETGATPEVLDMIAKLKAMGLSTAEIKAQLARQKQ